MKQNDDLTKNLIQEIGLLPEKEQQSIIWLIKHREDLEVFLNQKSVSYNYLKNLAKEFVSEGAYEAGLIVMFKAVLEKNKEEE